MLPELLMVLLGVQITPVFILQKMQALANFLMELTQALETVVHQLGIRMREPVVHSTMVEMRDDLIVGGSICCLTAGLPAVGKGGRT